MSGRATCTLLLVVVAAAKVWARAGPPFQTDDPTPVDFAHYEAYVFLDIGNGPQLQNLGKGQRSGEGPGR
jgi:hypothetical protein